MKLQICGVLLVIGCVLRTAQASGPDETSCPRPPDKAKPSVVVKQPDPRALYVNVSCEIPSDPAQQPVVVALTPPPATTPGTMNIGNPTKPAQGAADPAAELLPVVAGEWVVLGLILVIALWLASLGVRLMSSHGLVAATDPFLFRRHWGGFGGENSGWSLSAPAGKCVAGLLLIALGAGLAAEMLVVLHKHAQLEANVATQHVAPPVTPQAAPQAAPQKPQGKDAVAPALPSKLIAAAPDSTR
jgi:hypothetical protein